MPKVGMEPIRRDQIRKAATKVIAKRGLDRTTLADIAKAAKVSTGMINHYYKSKTALMIDTLLYSSEWFQSSLRTAISQADTPIEKLRQVFWIGVLDKKGMGYLGSRIWAWAMVESMHSKELALVVRERRQLFEDIIINIIHELDPSSCSRPEEVQELAAELDAYVNGLAVHNVTGAQHLNRESVARSLIQVATSKLRIDSATRSALEAGWEATSPPVPVEPSRRLQAN